MAEFAIGASLMATVFGGTLSWGYSLYHYNQLGAGVIAGARAGMKVAITNMVLQNASTQPTGYFGLTSRMVTVTQSDAGTNDNRLTVSITGYTYKTVTPFFAFTLTLPKIQVTQALGVFN